MRNWSFDAPDNYRASRQPFYIDDGGQLKLCLALARHAHKAKSPSFISAFGFAGTGKSALAKPLYWQLNAEGLPFSLLKLNCLDLFAGDQTAALSELRSLKTQYIDKVANYPMLIVLDEVEALAPKIRQDSGLWCMSLIKSIRESRLCAVVIACSNYPDSLDITIDSEFGPAVYFEKATRDLLVKLARHSGIGSPLKFAECYIARCGDRYVPLVRPYVVGLKQYEDLRKRHPRGSRFSSVEAQVELVQALSPQGQSVTYGEYERRMAPWIDKSKSFLKWASDTGFGRSRHGRKKRGRP